MAGFVDDVYFGVWTCLLLEAIVFFMVYKQLPYLLTVSSNSTSSAASTTTDKPADSQPPAAVADTDSSPTTATTTTTEKPVNAAVESVTVSEELAAEQEPSSDGQPIRYHEGKTLANRLFPPNMPLETCEWLSVILKQLFLRQIDSDINMRLCRRLNEEFGMLEEKSKILSYIYASKIDIGSQPPELKNFKLVPSDTARNDLDLQAKMIYNGGFSMELHTQIQLYSVIEAHVKVSVLECFGNINIRVTSNPKSPTDCIAYLSLTEDPQIKLDIQSAVGAFMDLSMIDQIISSTLKLILRRAFVEPNGIKFKWSPSSGFSVESISSEEKKNSEKKKKRKNFGPVAGRLHVYVQCANSLPGRENGIPHDSYCIISFNRQTKKTKIFSKSLDPFWKEHFSFDVFDQLDDIVLSVYDRDRYSKDDFIGNTIIKFNGIPIDEKITYVQILKQRRKQDEAGVIKFDVYFEKFHHQRMVIYNRDKDLSQFDHAFIDHEGEVSASVNQELTIDPSYVNENTFLSPIDTNFKFATTMPRPSLSPLDGNFGSKEDMLYRSASNLIDMFDEAPRIKKTGEQSAILSRQRPEPIYEMQVKIVQARGLMACDKSGLSDPYAQAYVGKSSLRTKIRKATLSPIWNETLSFQLSKLPEEVLVSIYDWNRFSQKTFMGEVKIPLTDVQIKEGKFIGSILGLSRVYPLNNVNSKDKNGKRDPHITGQLEVIIDLKLLRPEDRKVDLLNRQDSLPVRNDSIKDFNELNDSEQPIFEYEDIQANVLPERKSSKGNSPTRTNESKSSSPALSRTSSVGNVSTVSRDHFEADIRMSNAASISPLNSSGNAAKSPTSTSSLKRAITVSSTSLTNLKKAQAVTSAGLKASKETAKAFVKNYFRRDQNETTSSGAPSKSTTEK